jgi:hypothetical protein
VWDENRFSTWSFVVNGKWQLALIVGLIATLAGCQTHQHGRTPDDQGWRVQRQPDR